MAYTRGTTYIWSDSEHLHIWSERGLDHWPQMEQYQGKPSASGVQIAESIADEFAVMRFAELVASGEVEAVIARALSSWKGNTGCHALEQVAPQLARIAPRSDA
ncbi:hypothetical protein [Hydrogenophaga flava]|uniref:hypothetical protein n=1 Tax=Hydrogenophaga flava TaxID=65657 RepID=UPI0008264D31|nr:hypothetical protein [Hydrogenophaga flava]